MAMGSLGNLHNYAPRGDNKRSFEVWNGVKILNMGLIVTVNTDDMTSFDQSVSEDFLIFVV